MSNKVRNPITWVPSVYFAMGLPFVALNLVSVIMFNHLGVSKAEIAFWTSLLTLPYTLKFIWSPLLEIYWTKKNFCGGHSGAVGILLRADRVSAAVA